MENLHCQFASLSHRHHLASTAVALVESLARQRLHCPAGNSSHAHRHCHAHELQRYRFVPCVGTFNTLIGTSLARLRDKTLWLDYADCLLGSASVRQSAGLAP